MRLIFKQRLFSWLDSYDIYDESGNIYFTVEGRLSWGHEFHIYDAGHNYLAKLKEEVLTFLPRFLIFNKRNHIIGKITKKFTFFTPSFTLDMNGWEVKGDWLEWEYEILNGGEQIAVISKELFHLTDVYIIDVSKENALNALLVVLAIDAVKCNRK